MKLKHNAPLVSVLMGIYYQREDLQLLDRSINSILSQNFSDFELLICDDGSLPKARKAIDSIAERDNRIHLVRDGNLFSLPQKLNASLRFSQGTLIARMDDDDFSHPNRFETQIDYLATHPEIDFVGCNVRLWRNSSIVGTRQLPAHPSIQDFLFVQPFIHPTMMFRRKALLAVGGYSEDRHCLKCEDYDLLLRMYQAGYQGANLQDALLDYTVPASAKGYRTMNDRFNEVVTRYNLFRSLGMLPKATPYVIKPILVGLMPDKLLGYLKKQMGE